MSSHRALELLDCVAEVCLDKEPPEDGANFAGVAANKLETTTAFVAEEHAPFTLVWLRDVWQAENG